MLSALRRAAKFLAGRRALAALEFVLVAPVLVSLLYGVYDISQAMIVYQEVYNSAHSIVASSTNLAVNVSTNATSLTYNQIQEAESEIWGQIPTLRGDYQNGTKSVTISSVVFEPTFTTATCTTGSATTPCYVPVVVWSVAYAGGNAQAAGQTFTVSSSNAAHLVPFIPGTNGAASYGNSYTCGASGQAGTTGTTQCLTGIVGTNSGNSATVVPNSPLRPCDGNATIPRANNLIGSLNQTLPTAGSASDLTSLRTLNLTDGGPTTAPPSPIMVVDVHLQYTPALGLIINHAIDFWVSGEWPVRSVQTTVTGTTTPLTLYQQFTTISASTVYPVEPYTNYCLNNSLAGASVT
jgi:Flp pilus assembly protein TadG